MFLRKPFAPIWAFKEIKLSMKMVTLIVISVLAASTTIAQERIITEKEYDSATKAASAKAMANNPPTTYRKVASRRPDGSPSSEESLSLVSERDPMSYLQTYIFTNKGLTRKFVLYGVRKNGTAVMDLFMLEPERSEWSKLSEKPQPPSFLTYMSNPGWHNMDERIFYKSDKYKYLGMVTETDRKLHVYVYDHIRDFTFKDQAGTYAGSIKHFFTDDGSYYRSESETTRVLGGSKNSTRYIEEMTRTPGLTVKPPQGLRAIVE
jgi:hypothetical protein